MFKGKARYRHQLRPLLWAGMLAFLFLEACGTGDRVEYKPASAGKADEVLWVMQESLFQDTIGATVRRNFQKSYGILPQEEPEYFLREKNFNQFNNDIIKKYRTIVLCASREDGDQYGFARNLIEEEGKAYEEVVFLENVWAKPQIVVVVTANDREGLLDVLARRSPGVKSFIRESEDNSIRIQLYEGGLNDKAGALLKSKYGFSVDVPSLYYIAADNRDFTWLRHETVTLSSNIMVYKRSLSGEDLGTEVDWAAYAKNMRNYLGQSYISSAVEGSYMEIEERFAPVAQDTATVLGHAGRETQGLWRMEKDFMGGPFRNYAWFDTGDSTYYMVDFFVHAPKEGKKKHMRHLDYVWSTLKSGEQLP